MAEQQNTKHLLLQEVIKIDVWKGENMEDMKEFLSQFCEIEQMSMMGFVDYVNHAIQYFKLSREQYIKIYDLLVKED